MDLWSVLEFFVTISYLMAPLLFFIPLFFTYLMSRRIEMRLKDRFSRFFWLSVILMISYLILYV
jgi:hypothetical protein